MMFRRTRAPEIVAAENAVASVKEDAACELAVRRSLLRLALRKLGGSIEQSTDELIDTFQKAAGK